MKRILIAGLLALCAAALAQAPDPKRISAIWAAADERITRQTDAWFKDGDFPRSIQLLRFHFEMDTTNFDIGTNLGWMLENVQEWDDAHAVYIKLRLSSPNDPDNAWPEAYYYQQKRLWAKIPPILEPTIKGHDPHGNNYRTLAEAYEKMNQLANCKRVWDIYLSRHPEDLAGKAHRERIIKKMSAGSTPKK